MKRLPLSLLGTLATDAAPAQAPGQRADFVTTLGRDTVALESFTRTPARLDGEIVLQVTRVPTPREHFTIDVMAPCTTGELRIHRDTFVWTVAIAGR